MYEYIGTDLHQVEILNSMLYRKIYPKEVGIQLISNSKERI